MAQVKVTDHAGEMAGEFASNAEESVGVQAQDAGVPVMFGCGSGACGTCRATVTKGMEHLDAEAIDEAQIETAENEVLTCLCAVKPEAPADAEIELALENL